MKGEEWRASTRRAARRRCRGGSVSSSPSVLDLSAYTCLPGLIDAHTHLLLQGDATSEEYDEQVLKESTPYRALRAAAAARIALDHGFTTLRDLGTEGAGFTDVDLRKAFALGIVPGPRLVTAGPAMTPTGRYPLLGFSWERKMPDGVLKCDGADECRKGVRWQAQYGVDWIKVYADGSYYRTPDGGWASVPNFTQDEMNAIVDEAHRLRKKVAAHSMTPTGHRIALAAGVDSLEHGDVLDDETVKVDGREEGRVLPDDHRRSTSSRVRAARRTRSGTSSGPRRRSPSGARTRPAPRSRSGPTRAASTGTSATRPRSSPSWSRGA